MKVIHTLTFLAILGAMNVANASVGESKVPCPAQQRRLNLQQHPRAAADQRVASLFPSRSVTPEATATATRERK